MFSLILLISVVFWNLENCFDYFDGKTSASDSEFSSYGEKHWTKKRFHAKTETIGKTLLWAGAPDIVGVAEVENGWVMKEICESEVLHKCGYKYVHYDSPDRRGIDVGLMYRSRTMKLVASYPIRIDSMKTRDILFVELVDRKSGEHWHVFVNHHPSKLGGEEKSAPKRKRVMRTLTRSIDSLLVSGATHIVAMGDFNDTPDGAAFCLACPPLFNLGATQKKGTGTLRYRGKWELIDNFLVSAAVSRGYSMSILQPSFLMEEDKQRPGGKPKRTYIGPRYNGGVSDHLPIILSPAKQ